MLNKFRPVWLIAQRELRDQLRDWRVLFPMIVLTFTFPFLMNEFAKQSIDFLNQYEANLIVDRLVPFSILIIGFFPLTVSLVVALESFVGEKERGTIEPLLTAPFDDWQLYFGKLLVGAITPLAASCISIGLYLLMAVRQELNMPSPAVLVQLFVLTGAHALLMVSAAIVISVQSTSVKAANLLSSFVVIPVAILMQGEAVLLFWGNEQILWMGVAAVSIIALLLIRLGLAHFQREYLLGREIDNFNLHWVITRLRQEFMGGATSIANWYQHVLGTIMRNMRPALVLLLIASVVGIWLSYVVTVSEMREIFAVFTPEHLARVQERFGTAPTDLSNLDKDQTAIFLFSNNTRVLLLAFVLGLLSFGVLSVVVYMVNVSLMGGVYGVLELLNMSPDKLFLAGVLPHGIFELPALVIGCAVVLHIGAVIVTPQTGKSMGEVIIECIADWAKVFLGLVLPLLAIAALVEAYLTPVILLHMMGK